MNDQQIAEIINSLDKLARNAKTYSETKVEFEQRERIATALENINQVLNDFYSRSNQILNDYYSRSAGKKGS